MEISFGDAEGLLIYYVMSKILWQFKYYSRKGLEGQKIIFALRNKLMAPSNWLIDVTQKALQPKNDWKLRWW